MMLAPKGGTFSPSVPMFRQVSVRFLKQIHPQCLAEVL